ncbi:MAG: M23 family metallopeptidase [Thermomicrobiales bacterium]
MTFLPRLVLIVAIAVAALGQSAGAHALQDGGDDKAPLCSYPIGSPGEVLGDGFFVRHGYATENTWYNPGYWHAGEDWYALEGDTAGAGVYAIAAGRVVFAGSEYPGRVVIVQHASRLFSMYGHLGYDLPVAEGDEVGRGELLGTVVNRADSVPNHLHFEVRRFLLMDEVNGASPRFGFNCGMNCPPGPGYWPINASDHPSEVGWRNPTHVVAKRMFPDGVPEGVDVVVSSDPSMERAALWSAPEGDEGAEQIDDLPLHAGERYPLLDVAAGNEGRIGESAEAYELWYEIALGDGERAWVQAATASTFETGGDGRPSTIRLAFLPVVEAAE